MEMHQIRYFLAVAETLNFTRAAEECHVTQPSLSRAIRKLEEELGGELFRRERTRTHLTELGRRMQPMLRQAFESAAAAKAEATNYNRLERVPLRIGLSLTVHLDLMTPMLVELSRAFPGVDLHLVRATAPKILEELEAGNIELAVAADTLVNWERLEYWSMFEERFVLLVPSDKAQPRETLSHIAASDIVVRPYCETIAAPDEVVVSARQPDRRHEVSSDEDAARLVRCGMGIAIMAESSGRRLSDSVIEIDEIDHTRTIRAYGVIGRLRSKPARALLNLLRAADWAAIVPV